MQRAMKLTSEEAHIAMMNFEQCVKLMGLVDERLEKAQHKWLEIQAREKHDPKATEEKEDCGGDG
jgi:hypothetical protein